MNCPLDVDGTLKGVNSEQMISSAEMERMMKVQEVILKATAGSLKWWEAAEIIGISDPMMRRWRERYQEVGYDGLYDRRKHRPSRKRVPLKTAETVLQLYQEKYVLRIHAVCGQKAARELGREARQFQKASRHYQAFFGPIPSVMAFASTFERDTAKSALRVKPGNPGI
jgi:transposase